MSYSSNTSFVVTGGINGSRSGDKVDLGITKLDPNYAYFAFRTGTATRTVSGGLPFYIRVFQRFLPVL